MSVEAWQDRNPLDKDPLDTRPSPSTFTPQYSPSRRNNLEYKNPWTNTPQFFTIVIGWKLDNLKFKNEIESTDLGFCDRPNPYINWGFLKVSSLAYSLDKHETECIDLGFCDRPNPYTSWGFLKVSSLAYLLDKHAMFTSKVCQMLCWWMKNWPQSINIWDTVTKVVPSCYQAPFHEPNLILLAPFPTELAYLSMLIIREMVCTVGSADHLKNK